MNPVFVEGFPSHARLERARRRTVAPLADPRDTVASSNGTLTSAVREAAESLGVAKVGVWAFEGEESGLRLVTRLDRAAGAVEQDEHYSAELGTSFGRALGGVTSLTVEDADRLAGRAEPLRAWLRSEGIQAILAMPVRAGDRLLGFISLEETSGPHAWTSRDRDVAGRLARQVGASLTGDGRPNGREEAGREPEEAQAAPDAIRTTRRTLGEPDAGLEDSPELPREPVAAREALRSSGVAASPAAKPVPGVGRRVRRLSRIEGAALVHAEEAFRLLEALEVQDGYLRMLEDALADRAGDMELLEAAERAGDVVRTGIKRFVRFVAEGARSAPVDDLNRLMSELISAMAREVGDGGRLRIAPSSGALPVAADPVLLERAVVHLIRNAREASGSDAVIRVSWAPVVREAADGSDWEGARIRVEDYGEGIPAHDLPWLFEPFFSSREEDHPLQGLGLSTVQAIVEGHGGWVEARSRRNEGTEVDLYFPLVLPRPSGAMEAPEGPGRMTGAASWRRRILLVEADPLLSDLMDRILSRAGYQVEQFSTPMEAERRLRGDKPPVDLLIVSWDLSAGLSGVEFAESWQARRPGLPAVLLRRGGSVPESVHMGPGIGWISPPFEPGEIERIVDHLLEDRSPVGPVSVRDVPPGEVSGPPH